MTDIIPHWRDCKRNFKWFSVHRCQCPVYNGTLETFVWSIMRKTLSLFRFSKSSIMIISMHVFLQYKCASPRETTKHWYIIHNIYQINRLGVPLWIGHCHHCMEGHLILQTIWELCPIFFINIWANFNSFFKVLLNQLLRVRSSTLK